MQHIAEWEARLTAGWPPDAEAQRDVTLRLYDDIELLCRHDLAPQVMHWLQRLPGDVRDGCPVIRFIEAASLIALGHYRAAEPLAAALWRCVTEGGTTVTSASPPLPDDFPARVTVLAAHSAVMVGRYEHALTIIANGSSYGHTSAQQARLRWTACRAEHALGNYTQSAALAEQLLAQADGDPVMRIEVLVFLASLHTHRGQFWHARDRIEQAEAELSRFPHDTLRCLVHAAHAQLEIAHNNLPAALHRTEQALAHDAGYERTHARAALQLAHATVLGLLGRWPEAAHMLSSLDAASMCPGDHLCYELAWANHDAHTGQRDQALQRIAAIVERLERVLIGGPAHAVALATAAAAAGWPDLPGLLDRLLSLVPAAHAVSRAQLAWIEVKEAYVQGLPFARALASFVKLCEQSRLTGILGRAAQEAPHLFLAGLDDGIVSPLYPAVLPPVSAEQTDDLAAIALAGSRPAAVRQVAWHLLARKEDDPVTLRVATALHDSGDAVLGSAAARLLQTQRGRSRYRDPGTVEFRSFGDFALTYRGRSGRVRWRRKAQALFVLLMSHHPTPVTRLHAQEALWPELDQQAAANNLRVVMHNLRRTLDGLWTDDPPARTPPARTPPAHTPSTRPASNTPLKLACSGDSIWLDGADAVTWDARTVATCIHAARTCIDRGDIASAIAAYSHAVSLYRGPFMPDPAFESTFALKREHYARLIYETLLELAALHLDANDPERALAHAEQAIAMDPLDEIGHELAMRAYAALGYPHRAVAVYRRYEAAVTAETGARPAGTTARLLQQLMQNKNGAVAAPN